MQRLRGAPQRLGLTGRGLLVADLNTWAAAGRRAFAYIMDSGVATVEILVLREARPLPTEPVVDQVQAHADGVDFLIAVGGGTITDVVKYVSSGLSVPFIAVPTAPSMDGYTSSVSSMLFGGLKQTLPTCCPVGVYADLDVLSTAPPRLLAAGVGDLVAKYTARADWVLSHVVTGEYDCPQTAAQLLQGVNRLRAQADELGKRTLETVRSVMETLLQAGLAAHWVGSSRPTSGSEHLLAHHWEMRALQTGMDHPLHGDYVGVASVLMTWVYHAVLAGCLPLTVPDKPADSEFRQVYGTAADAVLRARPRVCGAGTVERAAMTRPEWAAGVQAFLPDPDELVSLLEAVQAPIRPRDLGISSLGAAEALRLGPYLRDRLTILSVTEADTAGFPF